MFHIKKNFNSLCISFEDLLPYFIPRSKLNGFHLTGLYTHAIITDYRKMEWPATSMFKLSSIKIYLSTGGKKLPTNFTSMSSSESSLHFTQFIILTFIL
jgi:hypothetical protein